MSGESLCPGTVLLAGGTGMIGSNFLSYLSSNRFPFRVRATYNKTAPFIHHPKIEYVQANLTTREGCTSAVQGCDVAVLAASNSAGIKSATSDPLHQVTDNLVMDAFLLEALHGRNVKRVIYLSSYTVYQETKSLIKEEDLDL